MDQIDRPSGARWLDRGEATAVATAPTVAFLIADAFGDLGQAVVVASGTAVAVFGWRLYRRQPLRAAVLGLLVVGACGAVAAATGQARGFFLIPALIPFSVIAVCVATIVIGRPLTGLVLNKVIGGPPRWWTRMRLRRVHLVLGALHIATGPVFAAIVAVTIGFARRYASSGG